LVNNRNL